MLCYFLMLSRQAFCLRLLILPLECILVWVSDFIPLEVCQAVYLYACISSKLEKCLSLFLQISLCFFFFLSLLKTPILYVLTHLTVFHRSCKLCSLFFNIFSFCSSESLIPIFPVFAFLDSLFCLLISACESLQRIFHFNYYMFKLRNFQLIAFLVFLFLY